MTDTILHDPELHAWANHLFNVSDPAMEANIGRPVRFINPTCGAQKVEGLRIWFVQRTWDSRLVYRLRASDTDQWGIIGEPSALAFLDDTLADPPNPICKACHTDVHPASAMQPAFCTECVNAMLHGRENRLTLDPPPGMPDDDDGSPDGGGPPKHHCSCSAPATVLVYVAGETVHLCSAHYAERFDHNEDERRGWEAEMVPAFATPANPLCSCCETRTYPASAEPGICVECWNAQYFGMSSRFAAQSFALPQPVMYCLSCLCVADDLGEGRWRCRNCQSPWRLDDLLTTSELIRRRAELGRIKVAVFARLTCKACGGVHLATPCPTLGQALCTEPDVDLGRELCRLRWRKYDSFVAMLVNADELRRLHYAESYIAFIRSHKSDSALTVQDVLLVWQRLIDEQDDDGPAAPALMLRAA